MDFAPMPCVCLTCCANTIQQGRTYTRVYDNRFEQNKPFAVCGVCTPLEICIIDFVTVRYFDKAPNRADVCCFCIPFTCCGQPRIFSLTPKCCFGFVDMSP